MSPSTDRLPFMTYVGMCKTPTAIHVHTVSYDSIKSNYRKINVYI